MHVIEQFNGGMYDTIIASDEKIMDQNDDQQQPQDAENESNNKKSKSKKLAV